MITGTVLEKGLPNMVNGNVQMMVQTMNLKKSVYLFVMGNAMRRVVRHLY
jgi:hypothetical protein